MKNKHYRSRIWSAAASTIVFSLTFLFSGFVMQAQTVFGLSGQNLIQFDAAAPGIILKSTTITGVNAGMELTGLDCRPTTGQLYALAYAQATGMAQLYVINPATAAATAIGNAPVALKAGMGKVSMDFNPTVDRIRVVSSSNANYRLHPVTGAVVVTDGNLAFGAMDVNSSQNPSIGAIAYTNSYIGATSTTLINYDDSLNIFCTQIPPNNGTLNTVGASGIVVDLTDTKTDFDIYFDAATKSNIGFFCANTAAASNTSVLFKVNLTTGVTALVGSFGLVSQTVSDIAVSIPAPASSTVSGQLAYALNSANALISFDTENPGDVRTQVGISGLTTGQVLVGMDFRPATGALMALGYNATTTDCQLYTVNIATGAATAVNATPFQLNLGTGANVGFDFNPTVDRIRVVASNNVNYRLNPITGAIAATDLSLAYAAGDLNAAANAAVGAAAYTNSFNGATATTLFVYDDSLNVLCTQIPPNNGTLNTIGASGLILNLTDPTLDMDIYYDFNTGTNICYAAANPAGATADMFYTIDLATGKFTAAGAIGLGIAVRDVAIFMDSIPTTSVYTPVQLDHSLVVAPNPATDAATLQVDLQQQGQARIYLADMLGRSTLVMQRDLPAGRFETRIDGSNQPAGLYLVQLYVDGKLRGQSKLQLMH